MINQQIQNEGKFTEVLDVTVIMPLKYSCNFKNPCLIRLLEYEYGSRI